MKPAYAGLLRWKQAPLEPAWKQVLIDITATILTAVFIVPYFIDWVRTKPISCGRISCLEELDPAGPGSGRGLRVAIKT